MKTKNKPESQSLPSPQSPVRGTTCGQVAERAHHLWEQAGRPEGQAQTHWLKAEAQLRSSPSPASNM